MVFDAHKNFAYSTVDVVPSPADSGTSLTVASGEGSRLPTPPFNATVWPVNTIPTPLNAEIIRVTNITGDVLTIIRAQEGTSARTILQSDAIAATHTSKNQTDVENAFATIALNDLSDVVIATPVVDQVIKYNGTNWINGSISTVNGGSGVDFFYSDVASDISTYGILQKNPDPAAETDDSVVCNNNKVLMEAYASPSTGLGGTQIDAGVWTFDIWAYVSMLNLASSIDIDIYKRTSGGTETLLFTVNSGTITATSLASVTLYTIASVQQAFSINSTDRLVAKVSGKTSNITDTTVHFVHGGTTHYSHFNTPLVIRHNDLAGLQGGTSGQYNHLTNAELTVVDATSGSNTGDQTFIPPRTNTVTSSATPTIVTATTDEFTITALAAAITSMTTNLNTTGIVNGQKLIIRIKDNGTARAITWGTSFASRGAILPVITVLGKYLYVGLIWNSTTTTFDCVSVVQET